jgi:hypothetical protein
MVSELQASRTAAAQAPCGTLWTRDFEESPANGGGEPKARKTAHNHLLLGHCFLIEQSAWYHKSGQQSAIDSRLFICPATDGRQTYLSLLE